MNFLILKLKILKLLLKLFLLKKVVLVHFAIIHLQGYILPISEKYKIFLLDSIDRKILSFLNYEPKIVSQKQLTTINEPKTIELTNISFAYKVSEKNVLNNINMVIHPYEKIELVGYNGAGKTNLIKLFMHLYDAKDGEITLDGINIKD